MCMYVCVLSHCVCAPFTSCVGEGAHMYVHVFPHHHLLMQSAIMWSAPLISLLCMVTVLWKSRLLCYSPVWFLGIATTHSRASLWHCYIFLCWNLLSATHLSGFTATHLSPHIGIPIRRYCLHLSGFLESLLFCVHL